MNCLVKGTNFFFVQGKLVGRKPERDGGETLTLLVDENFGKETFPKIYVSKRVKTTMEMYQNYYIEGLVEGGNEAVGKKTMHVQRFYATDIKPAIDDLEDYAMDRAIRKGSAFRSYLTGDLVRTIDINEEWGKIVLRVPVECEGDPNYIRISYNKKMFHLPELSELVRNKKYSAYCRISTPKKEVGGKEKTFCNLMLTNIEMIGA